MPGGNRRGKSLAELELLVQDGYDGAASRSRTVLAGAGVAAWIIEQWSG